MKTWKQCVFNLIIIGILAIAVTACTRKVSTVEEQASPQTSPIIHPQPQIEENTTTVVDQTQLLAEEKSFDYSKILSGDLSEFADVWWATSGGSRMQLTTNDGTLAEGDFISAFSQDEDGFFYWNVGHYNPITEDGWSYGVYLYPPGVEIRMWDYEKDGMVIVPSDTTRVRMGTGMEPPSNAYGIYYITTETPQPVWEG